MKPHELIAVKHYLESHPDLTLVQAATALDIATNTITIEELLNFAGYPKIEPANKLPDVSTLGN